MMRRARKKRWGNELARARARRLADFNERIAFASCGDSLPVHTVEGRSWAYIPIHAFADDLPLLRELDLTPGDCQNVDAYWRTEDDAYFVEVYTTTLSSRPPGLRATWWHDEAPQLHLFAVIDAPAITRRVFESVLEQFSAHDLSIPVGHMRRWPLL
ncbi:hypothetical protein HPC49_18725 [Pyxidicoccus fallax]|uniref:Uncharacterized protein n=1 Tax=Pyxidicoccus fallax TaxID=394095 RepID=A0A848LPN2_9BACT|nr:hypothetical protein [Pyxidicoccus fallax]NMO19543.1 hypothetical protein [Pyxidicoccus fallax]NPC80246.1 hypothetical protein [Pyxidicoccus fallax]